MGFLGGATGEKIANGMQNLGIAIDFTWVSQETRTNIVIMEESSDSQGGRSGHHLKVNEPGPTITSPELDRFMSQVDTRLASACNRLSQEFVRQTWIFSGSLPSWRSPGYLRHPHPPRPSGLPARFPCACRPGHIGRSLTPGITGTPLPGQAQPPGSGVDHRFWPVLSP